MSVPNPGRVFDTRNRIPRMLIVWAGSLMTHEAQEAYGRAIQLGFIALLKEWDEENGPDLDEMFKEEA